MVKNLWKEMHFICGKCGKEMIVPTDGRSVTYFCPEKTTGVMCKNQISVNDVLKVTDVLGKKVEESDDIAPILIGTHWIKGGIAYNVTDQEPGKITIEVVNQKFVGKV